MKTVWYGKEIMAGNSEIKEERNFVHMYLALRRTPGQRMCLRTVIKDEIQDLMMLENKCIMLGGTWRIHHTVNARDTVKAMKWLMKRLIDFPEKAGYIDVEWRTALLQDCCRFGKKKFMIDLDTKNTDELESVLSDRGVEIIEKHESPKGWHYIVPAFDTRFVQDVKDVTVMKDGYYFVKEVVA